MTFSTRAKYISIMIKRKLATSLLLTLATNHVKCSLDVMFFQILTMKSLSLEKIMSDIF